MKAKHISILILIAFWLTGLCYSGAEETQEQIAKWKGKIEYEDGIKVIKNPAKPVFGEIQFEFEEDLILGSEKNEDDIFNRIFDVKVDGDGNIYVYDIRDRKVRKISPNGEYLKDIGKRGQGPGEFQSPRYIWVDDRTGNLYVTDLLKIIVFDKQGTFRNNIHLKKMFTEVYVDADENVWLKGYDATESGRFLIFEKISSQGETLKEIVRFPESEVMETTGRTDDLVTVVSRAHGYEYKLFVSNIFDQSFICGNSKDYELDKFDKSGNLLCKIRIEERPQRFSGKEKAKILEKFIKRVRDTIQLPRTKPFFSSIFSDSEGRIYVQRMASPLTESQIYEYDILSKEGYYLYRTSFPYKPSVIKNNYFYAVVFDEEIGLELVKRFKVKNWEKIRSGL